MVLIAEDLRGHNMAGKRKLGIGFEVFCITVGVVAILVGMGSCVSRIDTIRPPAESALLAGVGWLLGPIMIGIGGIISMIRQVAERDDPPKRKHQDLYEHDLGLPRP